jgi:hypothetical protein
MKIKADTQLAHSPIQKRKSEDTIDLKERQWQAGKIPYFLELARYGSG